MNVTYTTAQKFSKLSNSQITLMRLEGQYIQNSKESSEKIQCQFGLIKQLEKHIVCHSVLELLTLVLKTVIVTENSSHTQSFSFMYTQFNLKM